MLVAIWHGGCMLAGKRIRYGRVLVCGRWDVIPGVLGPDISIVGEEPGLKEGKMREQGTILADRHLP
jgi:hypothetical protein